MVCDSVLVVKRTRREFARDSGAKEAIQRERENDRERKRYCRARRRRKRGKEPQRIIEGRKKRDEKSFTPMCSSRGAVELSRRRWG